MQLQEALLVSLRSVTSNVKVNWPLAKNDIPVPRVYTNTVELYFKSIALSGVLFVPYPLHKFVLFPL
jgi:hypothetical protein